MTAKRQTAWLRTRRDSAGQTFLILLLSLAFSHSMISELNAWDAIWKIADSVLHAIPGLASMEAIESNRGSIVEEFPDFIELFSEAAEFAVLCPVNPETNATATAFRVHGSSGIPHLPNLRGPPRIS